MDKWSPEDMERRRAIRDAASEPPGHVEEAQGSKFTVIDDHDYEYYTAAQKAYKKHLYSAYPEALEEIERLSKLHTSGEAGLWTCHQTIAKLHRDILDLETEIADRADAESKNNDMIQELLNEIETLKGREEAAVELANDHGIFELEVQVWEKLQRHEDAEIQDLGCRIRNVLAQQKYLLNDNAELKEALEQLYEEIDNTGDDFTIL